MSVYSHKILIICTIFIFAGNLAKAGNTNERVQKIAAQIQKIKDRMMQIESESAELFTQLGKIKDEASDSVMCCPHAGKPATAEVALMVANSMYEEIVQENLNDMDSVLLSFVNHITDVENLKTAVYGQFQQSCLDHMGEANDICDNTSKEMKKHRFSINTDGLNWNAKIVCGSTDNALVGSDCAELMTKVVDSQGVQFLIGPNGGPMKVFCDSETETGGWTVILRRDAAYNNVDFDVSFEDYILGFGDFEGEFWIGLNKTAHLTQNDTHSLLVEMEDYDGVYVTAEYKKFRINDIEDNFRLFVSRYAGTAGDSLKNHNMMEFSTRENDNDKSYDENCAEIYHSGWWFNDCMDSNLHGYHGNDEDSYEVGSRIRWRTHNGYHESLKKAQMKIRPRCY